MKTDSMSIFRKGMICLASVTAAAVIFCGGSAQAAESVGWSQDDVFDLLCVALQEEADDTEDAYDIAEDLSTESVQTMTSDDAQETALTEASISDIDEYGLISPEAFALLDWTNLATADVEEYVNVRAQADEDAQIVGRIYAGALVQTEGTDGAWTKITSGNVEGYAATEYLLFGEDAKVYTEENISYTAVVTVDSLRIRAQESTDSTVISAADEGDELTWDPQADVSDGWVAVICSEQTRYVAAEYVETGIRLGTALTNEEAEEYEASDYDSSDLDLLAALIFCEAGGESYAGKLAVGAVVMNRVKSSSYPDTLSGVIYQSGQFGPASSGRLASVLASGSATSSCYQAAEEALSGVSNIGSCLHFHAGSGSGTQIGNQVFY